MDITFHFHAADLRLLAGVFAAMVLGAAIGLEREIADKPAGLRTHMLVAGASCLFVLLSGILAQELDASLGSEFVQTDPVRIIQSVVTGIAFLGAGSIIRFSGEARVEGLTTAASILFSAAVGVCVAVSHWVLAVGTTVLALVALRGVGYLERRTSARGRRNTPKE